MIGSAKFTPSRWAMEAEIVAPPRPSTTLPTALHPWKLIAMTIPSPVAAMINPSPSSARHIRSVACLISSPIIALPIHALFPEKPPRR